MTKSHGPTRSGEHICLTLHFFRGCLRQGSFESRAWRRRAPELQLECGRAQWEGTGREGRLQGRGGLAEGEEGRHQRHSAHTVILPRASTRSDFLCGLLVAWGRELLEATGCNPETWYSSSAVNSKALATRITSRASSHFCKVGIVHAGSKGSVWSCLRAWLVIGKHSTGL